MWLEQPGQRSSRYVSNPTVVDACGRSSTRGSFSYMKHISATAYCPSMHYAAALRARWANKHPAEGCRSQLTEALLLHAAECSLQLTASSSSPSCDAICSARLQDRNTSTWAVNMNSLSKSACTRTRKCCHGSRATSSKCQLQHLFDWKELVCAAGPMAQSTRCSAYFCGIDAPLLWVSCNQQGSQSSNSSTATNSCSNVNARLDQVCGCMCCWCN